MAHAMDSLCLDLSLEPDRGPALAEPCAVGIGNPHAVFFVDDLDAVDLAAVGPVLENNALFPERANIGVVQVLGVDALRLRVWDRGAGLTLACGSGRLRRPGRRSPARQMRAPGKAEPGWRCLDRRMACR